MDKDTDPKQVSNIRYSDGYNASLSQSGNEKKISSFLGTTTLRVIAATVSDRDDIYIMGMYEAKAKIDDVETTVALTFLYNANDSTFKVFVTTEKTPFSNYVVYSQTFTTAEEALLVAEGNYFVDCKIYKEGGTSYAHFTDGVTEPKKIPLVITTAGKGHTTPYSQDEVQLIRTGFRGNISGIAVTSGGDLLCGTYQFALRLFHSTENKYTKFGLLTQPVFIGMDASATERSHGGVGFVSTNQIDLTMTFLEDYAAVADPLYTHYQLAVIENINGTKDRQATVKLLQPEALTDHTSAYTETFTYETNKPAKELVSISEITVDDAAVKSFRTLEIKNNRLIPANVEYHPLDYDVTAHTTVGAATATVQKDLGDVNVGYNDSGMATNYVGHFRDEVYRYARVYEDKYGNFSKPKVIDFSSLTAGNNQASAGIDYRFQNRGNDKYGTLIGATNLQALGLNIVDLNNHPTWAVAVHIVRVPRKKKIQFQTPLVPSMLVQPALAKGDYPAQRSSSSEASLERLNVATEWVEESKESGGIFNKFIAEKAGDRIISDAEKSAFVEKDEIIEVGEGTNPDGTYAPKNFYHILPKNLIRYGDVYGEEQPAAGTGTVYGTNSSFDTLSFKVLGGTTTPVWIGRGYLETSLFTDTISSVDTGVTFTYNDGSPILAADLITVTISLRNHGGSSWDSPYYTNGGDAYYDTVASPTASLGNGTDYYDLHDFHINIGFES